MLLLTSEGFLFNKRRVTFYSVLKQCTWSNVDCNVTTRGNVVCDGKRGNEIRGLRINIRMAVGIS